MKYDGNLKYEIFRTIIPPHITIFEMMLSEDVLK